MVKEVVCDVWFIFENLIKFLVFKMYFYVENECVFRLIVFFSCNVVFFDNIYVNNFFENLIE